ncbi:complex 1 domain-containing protein [Rhizoctonia solani AG-1 IA]|uniref:Complex 1 domain-containing protein n=1 Tax=Thanatephorus cucumeris (strain AG1-IA) TaxID=983506 RepID=L8WSS9_THACA|nr:complex 1 domain-containing protein [Rhizoctonia solani AG-1 IA]
MGSPDVLSLYRSLLREAHKLPDPLVNLRRKPALQKNQNRQTSMDLITTRYCYTHSVKKKLRQLQAANNGDKTAVVRTLRFAYGVSGPIRQQNLCVLTGNSPNPTDTRPPPFAPALKALLSSPLARTKPGTKVQPDEPLALSLALDRRGWLGKLPERRERNLWWNWWREEPTKTLVPTEIEVVEPSPDNASTLPSDKARATNNSGTTSSKASLRLRQLGLPVAKTQEFDLIHRAEEYSQSYTVPKTPRRFTERIPDTQEPEVGTSLAVPPQSRFMRRRYRELLSKMPLLSFNPAPSSRVPPTGSSDLRPQDRSTPPVPPVSPGRFSVSISPLATTLGPRNRTTYSLMTQEDRQWIERVRETKGRAEPKSGVPRPLKT